MPDVANLRLRDAVPAAANLNLKVGTVLTQRWHHKGKRTGGKVGYELATNVSGSALS